LPRAHRSILRVVLAGTLLGLTAAAAWQGFRWVTRPTRAEAVAAAKLPYPELVALARRTKSLEDQRRFNAALPGALMLLEQHELRGRLDSSMLLDFAGMLNNAAFENGAGAPRSSYERIALERQAIDYAHMALAKATTPRDRAAAITLVGLLSQTWGLYSDAYFMYRAAMNIDPTYEVARQQYDLFAQRQAVATAPVGAP
jgi:hypothetical protein